MSQETSFGIALQEAVKTLSKKQQVKLITDHIYNTYPVFKAFKPLAIGVDAEIIAALSQYDERLVLRALANHCRRPKYIERLIKGGKRFDLKGKVKGEVTKEEMQAAKELHKELSALLDQKAKTKRMNIENANRKNGKSEAAAEVPAQGEEPGKLAADDAPDAQVQ